MAKQKSTRKKSSRKRSARKKSQRSLSSFKLLSLLVLIVLLSVGGLYYLKDAFVKKDGTDWKSVELNKKISQIDSAIKEHLFNRGLSSDDIKFKTTEKSENGVKWKLKEGSARIESPDFDTIAEELEKLSGLNNITLNIKQKSNRLEAEISAFGYLTHRLNFAPSVQKVMPKKTQVNSSKIPATSEKKTSNEKPLKTIKNKPKIIIIVDDVGQQKNVIDKLVEIKYPVNFAVLPYLPYSEYAARSAHSSGKEVLLHLPMEPKYSSGYTAEDAGKGALLVGYSKDEIESQLDKNLDAVPFIKGVNNHMGSKFTENKELMELVLSEIKERNLYFVDSLTSNRSFGKSISNQIGLRFTERDVFLDDSKKGRQYVINQFNELVRIAEKNGVAVGICHTYPHTLSVLAEYLPKISERVEISSVTSIFK